MAHVKTIGLRTKVCIPWLLLLVTLSTFKLAGAEDPNGTSNDAQTVSLSGTVIDENGNKVKEATFMLVSPPERKSKRKETNYERKWRIPIGVEYKRGSDLLQLNYGRKIETAREWLSSICVRRCPTEQTE